MQDSKSMICEIKDRIKQSQQGEITECDTIKNYIRHMAEQSHMQITPQCWVEVLDHFHNILLERDVDNFVCCVHYAVNAVKLSIQCSNFIIEGVQTTNHNISMIDEIFNSILKKNALPKIGMILTVLCKYIEIEKRNNSKEKTFYLREIIPSLCRYFTQYVTGCADHEELKSEMQEMFKNSGNLNVSLFFEHDRTDFKAISIFKDFFVNHSIDHYIVCAYLNKLIIKIRNDRDSAVEKLNEAIYYLEFRCIQLSTRKRITYDLIKALSHCRGLIGVIYNEIKKGKYFNIFRIRIFIPYMQQMLQEFKSYDEIGKILIEMHKKIGVDFVEILNEILAYYNTPSLKEILSRTESDYESIQLSQKIEKIIECKKQCTVNYNLQLPEFANIALNRSERFTAQQVDQRLRGIVTEEMFHEFCQLNKFKTLSYEKFISFKIKCCYETSRSLYNFLRVCVADAIVESVKTHDVAAYMRQNEFFGDINFFYEKCKRSGTKMDSQKLTELFENTITLINDPSTTVSKRIYLLAGMPEYWFYKQYLDAKPIQKKIFITLLVKILFYLKDNTICLEKRISNIATLPGNTFQCIELATTILQNIVNNFETNHSLEQIIFDVKYKLAQQFAYDLVHNIKNEQETEVILNLKEAIRNKLGDYVIDDAYKEHSRFAILWSLARDFNFYEKLIDGNTRVSIETQIESQMVDNREQMIRDEYDKYLDKTEIYASDVLGNSLNPEDYHKISEYINLKYQSYNLLLDITDSIISNLKLYLQRVAQNCNNNNMKELKAQLKLLNSPDFFGNFDKYGPEIYFIWNEDVDRIISIKPNINSIVSDLALLALGSANIIKFNKEYKELVTARLEIERLVCFDEKKQFYTISDCKNHKYKKLATARAGYMQIEGYESIDADNLSAWLFLNSYNKSNDRTLGYLKSWIFYVVANISTAQILDCMNNLAIKYVSYFDFIDISDIFFGSVEFASIEARNVMLHPYFKIIPKESGKYNSEIFQLLKAHGYDVLQMDEKILDSLMNGNTGIAEFPNQNDPYEFKLTAKIMKELMLLHTDRKAYIKEFDRNQWNELIKIAVKYFNIADLLCVDVFPFLIHCTRIMGWIQGYRQDATIEYLIADAKYDFQRKSYSLWESRYNQMHLWISHLILDDSFFRQHTRKLLNIMDQGIFEAVLKLQLDCETYSLFINALRGLKSQDPNLHKRACKILSSNEISYFNKKFIDVISQQAWWKYLDMHKNNLNFDWLSNDCASIQVVKDEILDYALNRNYCKNRKIEGIIDLVSEMQDDSWLKDFPFGMLVGKLLNESTCESVKRSILQILRLEHSCKKQLIAHVYNLLSDKEYLNTINALYSVTKRDNSVECEVARTLLEYIGISNNLIDCMDQETIYNVFERCKRDKLNLFDLQSRILELIIQAEILRLFDLEDKDAVPQIQSLPQKLRKNYDLSDDEFNNLLPSILRQVDFTFIFNKDFILANCTKCLALLKWESITLFNPLFFSAENYMKTLFEALLFIRAENNALRAVCNKVLVDYGYDVKKLQVIPSFIWEFLNIPKNQEDDKFLEIMDQLYKTGLARTFSYYISIMNANNFAKNCLHLNNCINSDPKFISERFIMMLCDDSYYPDFKGNLNNILDGISCGKILLPLFVYIKPEKLALHALSKVNCPASLNERSQSIFRFLKVDEQVIHLVFNISLEVLQPLVSRWFMEHHSAQLESLFNSPTAFIQILLKKELQSIILCNHKDWRMEHLERLRYNVNPKILMHCIRNILNSYDIKNIFPRRYNLLTQYVNYIPISQVITANTSNDIIIQSLFNLCHCGATLGQETHLLEKLGFNNNQIKIIKQLNPEFTRNLLEAFLRNRIQNIVSIPILQWLNEENVYHLADDYTRSFANSDTQGRIQLIQKHLCVQDAMGLNI